MENISNISKNKKLNQGLENNDSNQGLNNNASNQEEEKKINDHLFIAQEQQLIIAQPEEIDQENVSINNARNKFSDLLLSLTQDQEHDNFINAFIELVKHLQIFVKDFSDHNCATKDELCKLNKANKLGKLHDDCFDKYNQKIEDIAIQGDKILKTSEFNLSPIYDKNQQKILRKMVSDYIQHCLNKDYKWLNYYISFWHSISPNFNYDRALSAITYAVINCNTDSLKDAIGQQASPSNW